MKPIDLVIWGVFFTLACFGYIFLAAIVGLFIVWTEINE